MNWYEWLGFHTMDFDADEDTLHLMKKAYIAGLQQAYDRMYMNEDGDYDYVMYELKKMLEESK